MFLYNITYKVDNNITSEWLQWQKEIHIPAMLNTVCFHKHCFYELLEQDDTDGKTFVIQFFSNTKEDHDNYILLHAKRLRDAAISKWGNQVIAFRTLLQEID